MRGPVAVGSGVAGLLVVVITYLMNGDASQLEQLITDGDQTQLSPEQKAAQDSLAQFVGVVLAETEDVWNKQFALINRDYVEPTLNLFTGAVQSACGSASSASGPFYCPGDQQLYIDLSFYDELRNRFGAPGDFAMAYVVAHEVGHHVQTLLGTSAEMNRLRGSVNEKEYNKLSVDFELQADFYAGLWANHTQRMSNILEQGDIEEALNAANAIGDDRLQKQTQGYVVPDAFTHGTSQQRMYWFKKGYETGDINQGNTFKDNTMSGVN
jgi:predicted metalloprotease